MTNTNTPDQAASEREKFANKVCPKCNHKNYFVRLDSCPNCDEVYMTDDTKPESAGEPRTRNGLCVDCGNTLFFEKTPGNWVCGECDHNKSQCAGEPSPITQPFSYMQAMIDRQEKTILELRAALEFYANEFNYDFVMPGKTLFEDCGKLARETLARTEPK